MRLGLPDGSSSCIIIIIITTTPFDVEGREVGVARFIVGIWYGTSLVYGMVHCWFRKPFQYLWLLYFHDYFDDMMFI